MNLFNQIFVLSLFAFVARANAGAIFGHDDRQSILPNSVWSDLSRSTAVAVLQSNIKFNADNTFDLLVNDLSDYFCAGERFREEPSLHYACTGFLVAPNLLATAGHCMVNTGETKNETELFCKSFSWVFDYQNSLSGKAKLSNIAQDKMYRCKQIIYAVKDEKSPYKDYALVELDHEVTDRAPFKLTSKSLKTYDELSMIGYPLGFPVQVATNGKILFNDLTRDSFFTNLDAFEGNSGSPVLNSNNEVVGILIGGTPSLSFVDQPTRKCAKFNACSVDGKNCLLPEENSFKRIQHVGSEVQRIDAIISLLEELKIVK